MCVRVEEHPLLVGGGVRSPPQAAGDRALPAPFMCFLCLLWPVAPRPIPSGGHAERWRKTESRGVGDWIRSVLAEHVALGGCPAPAPQEQQDPRSTILRGSRSPPRLLLLPACRVTDGLQFLHAKIQGSAIPGHGQHDGPGSWRPGGRGLVQAGHQHLGVHLGPRPIPNGHLSRSRPSG